MIRHFFGGIRVCDLLEDMKPNLILELGVGGGQFALTTLAYNLRNGHPYKLVSVSDALDCPLTYIHDALGEHFCYISGLTWEVLSVWKFLIGQTGFQETVDVALVDSDHNYFTVKQELEKLYPILSERCVVLFHDVKTPSTIASVYGAVKKYMNGGTYPEEEVKKTLHIHFKQAIEEFLLQHPEFQVLKESDEHEGCLAIGRNFTWRKESVPCQN